MHAFAFRGLLFGACWTALALMTGKREPREGRRQDRDPRLRSEAGLGLGSPSLNIPFSQLACHPMTESGNAV